MNTFLHKRYYYLVSLPLLSLCSGQLLAAPGLPVTGGKPIAPVVRTAPVDFWVENFNLPNGTLTGTGSTPWTSQYTGSGQASQRFAVYNNEFRVNNITVNETGTWTSGSINIAGKTEVSIRVDLRSGITGKGSLDDDNSDHYDYMNLYYKIDNGPEQLFWQKRGAINNNSAINTTVTKDSLNGSTLQLIIRARATATDEFYFFDNVRIAGIDPVMVDADAVVNGLLTCTNTTVLLSGSSSATSVNYSWAGPGGFTAAGQQAAVSVPGLYTLTVSGAGGAVATDTVTVLQNIVAPANLTAFATDQLTCFNAIVTINGSSGTPGVTYSWTGPGGFNAATATTAVTAGGGYTLKVTNPVNGCFRTISINVGENRTPPAGVTAVASGILTCSETVIVLTSSSSTPEVDYSWTGPDDFSSSAPEEFVSTPGLYVLTVTDLVNGCVALDSVSVVQDLNGCERSRASSSMQVTADRAADASLLVADWKLYPNPARGKFVVSFRAPGSGLVTASLYNSNGMQVKQLFNGQATTGQLVDKEADGSGLPAGIYYCIIRINDKIYVRKPLFLQ